MVPPQSGKSNSGKKKLPSSLVLLFSTTKGNFMVKIYPSKAPEAAEAFLDEVKKEDYNSLKFFRILKKPVPLLIQTGAPENNPLLSYFKPRPFSYKGIPHYRGSIAMAVDPLSGGFTSQFYILLSDAPYLDRKDPVIGEIIKGMEVIKKIGIGDSILYIKQVSDG